MTTWSLGLGGSDHDFSAALMHGSDIRVAVEEERLSRQKHAIGPWFEEPYRRSIEYCLSAEGIGMDDVDRITSSDLLPSRVRFRFRDRSIALYSHHQCHAASAYLMLPQGTRAGIIVYDGFGSALDRTDQYRTSRETLSLYVIDGVGQRHLGTNRGCAFDERDDFPTLVTNSIGILYELVTAILGYDALDAGKTMGLASYGTPRYHDVLERYIIYGDTPSDCFSCHLDDPRLADELMAIRMLDRDSFAVRADLAASVQSVVNKTLIHAARMFSGERLDCLCVTGGCALNAVATSWLIENSPLSVPVVVAPHCGDVGIAFGALWLDRQVGTRQYLTFRGGQPTGLARAGRTYSAAERQTAAAGAYPQLVLDTSIRSGAGLARLVADGGVIGVVNGRSEMGPRALGGRSIIGDPRTVATRERINRQIKRREPFQPLAPIVLEADYEEYFEDPRCADPFMLKIARVRQKCREAAPAVVHVDGTARVQVVPKNGDPLLIEMLSEFRRLTGVGLLINTSFNRRGEPIVESPIDAVDAFVGMGLDGLYLDGDFYRRAVGLSPIS